MSAALIAGRLLSASAAALPWVAAAAVGAAAWHYAPIVGAGAQIGRLEASGEAWRKAADENARAAASWEGSFRSAEILRADETARAQAAATNLIQQCSARVAEARASARVIERIVTKEPTYDANRCPVRERVDPGQLRDALRPTG